MCRRRRTFTRRNCANWVKMFSDDPQQAFPAPRPMMSKHKSLEPLRKWLQIPSCGLTVSLCPPAALDGHQALRFGLVDQREYNWDGRGRALERGRRHRAGTDELLPGANATTLRDYLLNDIRRDMDRRVSKFASGKMSILSIKFAVSSRGFPDPCNQFPVLLRREFNSKPLNFLIDWTSKSPKEA